MREKLAEMWEKILKTNELEDLNEAREEKMRILEGYGIQNYFFDEDGDLEVVFNGKKFLLHANEQGMFNPNIDIIEIQKEV